MAVEQTMTGGCRTTIACQKKEKRAARFFLYHTFASISYLFIGCRRGPDHRFWTEHRLHPRGTTIFFPTSNGVNAPASEQPFPSALVTSDSSVAWTKGTKE